MYFFFSPTAPVQLNTGFILSIQKNQKDGDASAAHQLTQQSKKKKIMATYKHDDVNWRTAAVVATACPCAERGRSCTP